MEAPLRDLAVLATFALLFVAVAHVIVLARHRRELDARLFRAQREVETLRLHLAEATRPPMQFARMRMRERALYRFGRLRRAVPRRTKRSELTESMGDLAH